MPHFNTSIPKLTELMPRLRSYVEECGGVYYASVILNVSPSTLRKALSGKPLSDPTIKKVSDIMEKKIGLTELIPRLRSYVEKYEKIHHESLLLNIRPSTLRKVLYGKPLFDPKIKKVFSMIAEKETEAIPPPPFKSGKGVLFQVKEMISKPVDVFKVSSTLGVSPSTIRKILEGKLVSRGIIKKIQNALKNRSELGSSGFHRPSMVERLLDVYNLYKKKRTLEAVGKEIGLTRERVRQLLAKGMQLGLFEYKPYDYPFIPKEKILQGLRRGLTQNAVAKENNISAGYLHRLLTAYNITEKDLQSIRIERQKLQCIEEYNRIKEKLGHHPTTTELQDSKSWRYLSIKITRLWRSTEAFREELNIPKPPSFLEATQKWRDHRRRLALIARMQNLDRVRESLSMSDPIGISDIAFECDLTIERTRRLLGLLIATKEVVREGSGSNTKYCFVGEVR